jgi:ribosome-binding protein aMBF1 (putative translation factor)
MSTTVCEYCGETVDLEKDAVEGVTPTILICPDCGEALDEYGWVWGDNPEQPSVGKEVKKAAHRRAKSLSVRMLVYNGN